MSDYLDTFLSKLVQATSEEPSIEIPADGSFCSSLKFKADGNRPAQPVAGDQVFIVVPEPDVLGAFRLVEEGVKLEPNRKPRDHNSQFFAPDRR